jgi:hypothetical protein
MLPSIGLAAAAIAAAYVVPSSSFSEQSKQPNVVLVVKPETKSSGVLKPIPRAEETKKESKMGGGVQGPILANEATPQKATPQKKKKSPTTDGANYPGSANGGVWKNNSGDPAVDTRVRPGPGYDIGPNKKN